MTKRKPPDMTFPGWVEQQIRTAEAQGAFENLPGRGRPIPDLDRPQHDLDWVAGYLRRENVDVADVLPPALALAKEVEDLPGRLAGIGSERRARQLVDELNTRIDHEYARAQVGPPLRVKRVNVEDALAQWRADRSALAPPSPQPEPEPPPTRRRRWFPMRTEPSVRSGRSAAGEGR